MTIDEAATTAEAFIRPFLEGRDLLRKIEPLPKGAVDGVGAPFSLQSVAPDEDGATLRVTFHAEWDFTPTDESVHTRANGTIRALHRAHPELAHYPIKITVNR